MVLANLLSFGDSKLRQVNLLWVIAVTVLLSFYPVCSHAQLSIRIAPFTPNEVRITDFGPGDMDDKPHSISFDALIGPNPAGTQFFVSGRLEERIIDGKSAYLILSQLNITAIGALPVMEELIVIESNEFAVPTGPPFIAKVHLDGEYGVQGVRGLANIISADIRVQGFVEPGLSTLIGQVDPAPGAGKLAPVKFGPPADPDASKTFDFPVTRLRGNLIFSLSKGDRIRLPGSAIIGGYTAERIFTVNSPADTEDFTPGDEICADSDGNCTLRAALTESELSPDNSPLPNAIHFNIPGSDDPTIHISNTTSFNRGSLGALKPVIIDGTTQPSGLVVVDGSAAPEKDISDRDIVGLDFVGKDIEVRGLVITGFPNHGIQIRPTGTTEAGNILIEGNFIQNNSGNGLHIFEMPNNTISGNYIRENLGHGIAIEDPDITPDLDGKGNSVLGNIISTNGGLGISLSGDANNGQAAPELSAATSDGVNLTIQGTINGLPGMAYIIQFFTNSQCDPSGSGEGEDFIGSAEVTPEEGSSNFLATIPVSIPPGQLLTATATDAEGNTSAFSVCFPIEDIVAVTADLELTHDSNQLSLHVEEQATDIVRLVNLGPVPATGIAVRYTVPAIVSIGQVTPSTGTFDTGSGIWSVSMLDIGEEATLTVAITALQAGEAGITAEVMAVDQPDPDSSPGNGDELEDDQSTLPVSVSRLADLELVKTADKATVAIGEALTFTLRLLNKGPSEAINTIVTDLPPAGMSFSQATATVGSFDTTTGIWTIAQLNSGSEAVLTIVASATMAGNMVNTAEVTETGQPDPDSSPGNGVEGEDDLSSVALQVTDQASAEEQIEHLIARVNELVASNELSRQQGRILTQLLSVSLQLEKRGLTRASVGTMKAFIAVVRALTRRGDLSGENGTELILAAQLIIEQLESDNLRQQSIAGLVYREEKTDTFVLYPNVPNPFSQSTEISFELFRESKVQATAYDLSGRFSISLLDEVKTTGLHHFTWRPERLPAGVYVLIIKVDNATKMQRLVYVK